MPKKYQIAPTFWLIRDEAGVKFHVKSGDYFGTMATVLSLLKQQINKNGAKSAVTDKTLKNLEKDLLFLQKNYQINPKIKNKNKIPKGKLKSQ
jgi:hypothetical protein